MDKYELGRRWLYFREIKIFQFQIKTEAEFAATLNVIPFWSRVKTLPAAGEGGTKSGPALQYEGKLDMFDYLFTHN